MVGSARSYNEDLTKLIAWHKHGEDRIISMQILPHAKHVPFLLFIFMIYLLFYKSVSDAAFTVLSPREGRRAYLSP